MEKSGINYLEMMPLVKWKLNFPLKNLPWLVTLIYQRIFRGLITILYNIFLMDNQIHFIGEKIIKLQHPLTETDYLIKLGGMLVQEVFRPGEGNLQKG